MHRLYETVKHNPRCLFVEFPTGMHMDTWFFSRDQSWQTIQCFLVRELPKPEGNEERSRDGWKKNTLAATNLSAGVIYLNAKNY